MTTTTRTPITAADLDLNYSPVVLCNIEGMSEEEWLGWRRHGIGGSDAGTVFGVNPYRTKLDLFYDKTGKPPIKPQDKTALPLVWGHALEPVVANEFAKKTGHQVKNDLNMYQHPHFPFMLADVDRLIDMPDGTTAILEIKTANPAAKFKWEDGAVPYSYELQVRHYMAVMNINVAYICCAFENNSDSMAIRRLDRDLDFEAEIIEAERDFWENHVLKGIPPKLDEDPNLCLESLNRYIKAKENKAPLPLTSFTDELLKIKQLREAKGKLEKEVKLLDEQIKALYVPILEFLGENTYGAAQIDGKSYELTYKPQTRTGIDKDGIEKMSYSHPEIYKEYVKETTNRVARFAVKKAK